jgi:uncharacterized BrkB/YihY/UPF0761 family membrane protein
MGRYDKLRLIFQLLTLTLILSLTIALLIISLKKPSDVNIDVNWREDTLTALGITAISLIIFLIIFTCVDYAVVRRNRLIDEKNQLKNGIGEFEVLGVIKITEM